jgi:anti-sigma B factor antagonist
MSDNALTYSYSDGSKEGTTILKLVGPLTLSNMFAFQGQFRSTKPPCLILDMTEVPYMDSAGLGLLTNYFVSAQDDNRKFLLACVSDRIMSLLQMTKVDQILKMYPSVSEAENAA